MALCTRDVFAATGGAKPTCLAISDHRATVARADYEQQRCGCWPTQTRTRRVRARSITSEVKFLVNFAAQRGGPRARARSSPPINATSSQPLPAPGQVSAQAGSAADETQASSQVQVLIRPELDAGGAHYGRLGRAYSLGAFGAACLINRRRVISLVLCSRRGGSRDC